MAVSAQGPYLQAERDSPLFIRVISGSTVQSHAGHWLRSDLFLTADRPFHPILTRIARSPEARNARQISAELCRADRSSVAGKIAVGCRPSSSLGKCAATSGTLKLKKSIGDAGIDPL